jgi:hypothetical protein
MIAARVREQAARGPSPEELARIAADALGVQGRDMSAGEIRHLAVTALTQAQQVSYLLGKLAALLEEGNR